MKTMRAVDGLPAGPPLPGAVQTVAWGLRPWSFFDACRRRYGPTFTMRFYDGRPVVVVSKPDDIRAVFGLHSDEFTAGSDNVDMLEPFLGSRSVLSLDGEAHRDERRRMQRAFRAERLDTYRQMVVDAVERDVATWPVGHAFAMHDRARAITLDVILRAVFGPRADIGPLRGALATFLAGSSGSPLALVPAFRRDFGARSPWGRFVRERADVHAEVYALVDQRIATGSGDDDDILSALLDAEGPADRDLLLDELMTLVLAGHDTTATGLAWTFDLLLHHPAALDRLREELTGDDDSYLDAVMNEALRLRPVIGEVGRRTACPFAMSAGELPAGTGVVASIYLAHVDPDRYDDASAFRPERFSNNPPELFSWLPFGGGTRRCLGAGLATLEMREVLRTVVSSVELRPVNAAMDRPKRRAVTVMPRHGCRVEMTAPR